MEGPLLDATREELIAEIERLRDDQARYRALTDNARDLIVEVDSDGRMLYVSPSALEILGRSPEVMTGRLFEEVARNGRLHPDDEEKLFSGFRRQMENGANGWLWSWRLRHPDGEWRWYETRARTYRNRRGERRAVLISRDTTELTRLQKDLVEIEKRYAILGRTSRDVITESSPEQRLVYVSPSATQMLGFSPEELVGTPGRELIHPEDRERVRSDFWESPHERGVTFTPPYRCRCKDGSYRWCEGTAVAYYRADGSGPWVIGLLRDVHERIRMHEERRNLEERMRQTQRLEGLGVMAGGIAHDFNNLLTPILGQASLGLMDLPEGSALHRRLQKIRSAARHAAKLTNQMLAYAGSGRLVFESIDISRLVQDMGQLLEGSASGSAAIDFELTEGLPPIEADSAQISQVVMNLITNAIEAVDEGEGRISLRTSLVAGDSIRDRDLVIGSIDRSQDYVCFEVEDNGCGMDAETRARIFDPFFTTKFTGRGLGLAAALGIVRAHAGIIELQSEPGHGTRFRVHLPASSGELPKATEGPSAKRWQTSGLVLVADDDEGVRDLAVDTLARLGLTAVCAADGAEAVSLFREHAGELRAVLLDRTMPLVTGEQALAQMREVDPSVPIVLVSGYSAERTESEFATLRLDGFLKKPFLPEELIQTVRLLLED